MSKDFDLYCFSLTNNQYKFIKELNYIPVGLGKNNFDDGWLLDNTNKNISQKNKHYGELTFYYWYWKNKLESVKENRWVGFCHYRRFWLQNDDPNFKFSGNFKNIILDSIPKKWDNHDAILVKPYFINNLKLSKAIKKGLDLIIKNPLILVDKNKRNINFHFDMWHGRGNLKKSIELLDDENKKDFLKFVETEVSFNAHLMIFSRSKKLMKNFFDSLFPWLFKCESLFTFESLKDYDTTRIYAFLAERYMSYWFKKNSNYLEWPMLHHDIKKEID